MSARPAPGHAIDALALSITHEDLAPEQLISGTPRAGSVALEESETHEIGVWEMTPGTAGDTEFDEVFVVIAGRARIAFVEPFNGEHLAPLDIAAGSIVRLAAGMRTAWTVTETLRKVYIA